MTPSGMLKAVQPERRETALPPSGLALHGALKPKKKLKVQFLRELTEPDMIVAEHTQLGSVAPTLKRLRDTHHLVARLIASGLKDVEVSAVTGMCPSRISILKGDPAFKDLLEFYRQDVAATYANAHQRLALVALEATAELHERLMTDPAALKVSELIDVAKLGHDRTGLGPTQKTENRTLVLSAEDLNALKEDARARHSGKITKTGSGAEISLVESSPTEWSDGEAGEVQEELPEEGDRV